MKRPIFGSSLQPFTFNSVMKTHSLTHLLYFSVFLVLTYHTTCLSDFHQSLRGSNENKGDNDHFWSEQKCVCCSSVVLSSAAPLFPGQRMSPAKALTMKDYENVSTTISKCLLLFCFLIMREREKVGELFRHLCI